MYHKKNSIIFLSLIIGSALFGRCFHAERLHVLKKNGFDPKIIYDIGAHQGFWTAEVRSIFTAAHFILFEANECHAPYLQRTGFPYFIGLLGDQEKLVPFYSINGTGDSIFIEQTQHYKEGKCTQKYIAMTTLDKLVRDKQLPLPDFIKMDVQGAEKLVIEGGIQAVCHAQAVLLEIGILEYNKNAPLLLEMMNLMDQIGFMALDFLELHYLPTQELIEVDVLFVKKNSPLIKTGILC